MGPTGRHVVGAERRESSHHLLQESHRSRRQVCKIPLATLQSPGASVRKNQGTIRLQEAAQCLGPRSGKYELSKALLIVGWYSGENVRVIVSLHSSLFYKQFFISIL